MDPDICFSSFSHRVRKIFGPIFQLWRRISCSISLHALTSYILLLSIALASSLALPRLDINLLQTEELLCWPNNISIHQFLHLPTEFPAPCDSCCLHLVWYTVVEECVLSMRAHVWGHTLIFNWGNSIRMPALIVPVLAMPLTLAIFRIQHAFQDGWKTASFPYLSHFPVSYNVPSLWWHSHELWCQLPPSSWLFSFCVWLSIKPRQR